MRTNKDTVKLLSEIDSIIEDIQVHSILLNDKTINLLFSEKITPILLDLRTIVEIENFFYIDIKEKINNCVALTSEIVDLNPKFQLAISRLISLMKSDMKVGFSSDFSDKFYNIQLDISKSGIMEKGFKQINWILAQ